MPSTASRFDPWGPVSSVLYEINDSDFVQDAIANTGVEIAWRPFSKSDAYSHGTRIRALRRDISEAYARLTDDQKGIFAEIVIKAILRHRKGEELREALLNRLSDIGWTILEDGQLATKDALVSEQFFPPNSEYDAYIAIRHVLFSAQASITIVDAYVASELLQIFAALPMRTVDIKVLTVAAKLKPDFRTELNTFTRQNADIRIEIRHTHDFHDRFIIVDDTAYFHVGASIKDAGRRAFMISRIEDPPNITALKDSIVQAWVASAPYV
jgi:hypothetical protein